MEEVRIAVDESRTVDHYARAKNSF